jgi:hypothetical protein
LVRVALAAGLRLGDARPQIDTFTRACGAILHWGWKRRWLSPRGEPGERHRATWLQRRAERERARVRARLQEAAAGVRLLTIAVGAVAPTPSVDEEDLAILRALAVQPHRRMSLDQIAAFTAHPRVGRRTVAARVPRLLAEKLVTRPRGKRSGYIVTPRGREVLTRAELAENGRG